MKNEKQNHKPPGLIPHRSEQNEESWNVLDEDNFSEDGGSEGGDDILCTQLRDAEEAAQDSSEDIVEDVYENKSIKRGDTFETKTSLSVEGESHKENATPPFSNNSVGGGTTGKDAAATTPTARSDVCLICGASLAKLKNRLSHIKRCAKKHGIAARDVKVNTDMEDFQMVNEDQDGENLSTKNIANPYISKTSSWHGDANLALRLAAGGNVESETFNFAGSTVDATHKQTSLDSFLDNPVRNLNNVLIAGARRMTKTAELRALREASNKDEMSTAAVNKGGFRGRKRGRGSWSKVGTSSYTSRRCPMHKKIPGTDFVCDGFYFAKRYVFHLLPMH